MEAPTEMVEFVNEIVAAGYHHRKGKKKKRGHYNVYSADQRAKIGQYAQEHGIMPAVRKFRNEFDRPLQDSSVRSMRKAYMEARKHLPDEDVEVTELPTKERGRPLMLGEYDSEVVEYVEALKRNGVQINHQIVMDAARGVLLHHDKNKLKEFGGPIAITRKWAESFIRRIKKWIDPDEPDMKRAKEDVDEDGMMTEEDIHAHATVLAQHPQDQIVQQLEHRSETSQPQTIHIQHAAEGTIFSMAPAGLSVASVHSPHNYHNQQNIDNMGQQQHIVTAQGLTMQPQTHQIQHIQPLQQHMIATTPQQMTHITQLPSTGTPGQPVHTQHSQMPT